MKNLEDNDLTVLFGILLENFKDKGKLTNIKTYSFSSFNSAINILKED